jgi:D-proline reductase (dithiol) PrdB
MAIDGYHFLDGASRRVMRAWEEREPTPDSVPWTPLSKPLSQVGVALVSSAGIALRSQPPFDQGGERVNPWWGDPSHRVIPREAATQDIRIHHLHIDPRPGESDLDSVLPLRRLDELVDAGVVGRSAPRHYSMMGYILDPTELLRDTAPTLAASMIQDEVDLALLVPV